MSTGAAMQYRRFGRTGLAMPVFSCGGMRYQESWSDDGWDKISAANQAGVEATIHRALECGINHIETARGYGTSERQLGRILPRLPREKIIVQTKVSPQDSNGEFREQFALSLERLNLEFVDLFSFHGLNTRELVDAVLAPGGRLEVAREWQREGRVRHVGFSTHAPPDVITYALQSGEFDYVNLHWYWIYQDTSAAVEEARRQDAGVFIISPNDKGGKLYEPPARLCELCQPLSPMVFNDLFCLSHPEVHTLSLGVSRPEDFDEHLQVLPLLERASELLPPIVGRLESRMEEVLGREWMQHWREGLPSWEAVPGDINLEVILRLWNLDRSFDMREYAKMRYNMLGSGGHWFPGLRAGNFEEKALQQVLGDYPFAERVPAILRQAHQDWAEAPKRRLSAA
jgi:predicted aldo/keto reductase-like oxidoreductase